MRKPLFFVIFSLLIKIAVCTAQPILTMENLYWGIGVPVTVQYVDTTNLSPGPSGANATWNFSNISLIGAPITSSALHPDSTPYADKFPQATMAELTPGGNYGYGNLNASKSEFLGYYSTQSYLVYDDPETQFIFPFTFGTTNTDAFIGTINPVDIVRKGKTTVAGDAFGKLILPSGTYENSLRVKIVQDYYDSSATGSKTNYLYEAYAWYCPSVTKGYFFSIGTLTVTTPFNTTLYKNGYIQILKPAGISDDFNFSFFKVYPNPIVDKINIILPPEILGEQKSKFYIYDLTGRIMNEISSPLAGNNSIEFFAGDIPAGIYILEMHTKGKIIRQKINKISPK